MTSESEEYLVAIHEAGHAVAGYRGSLGPTLPLHVTIKASSDYRGLTKWNPSDWQSFGSGHRETLRLLDYIVMTNAGGLAAQRAADAVGEDPPDGHAQDLINVERQLMKLDSEATRQAVKTVASTLVRELLEQHWEEIKAVARELLAKDILTGQEVADIVESVSQQKPSSA